MSMSNTKIIKILKRRVDWLSDKIASAEVYYPVGDFNRMELGALNKAIETLKKIDKSDWISFKNDIS